MIHCDGGYNEGEHVTPSQDVVMRRGGGSSVTGRFRRRCCRCSSLSISNSVQISDEILHTDTNKLFGPLWGFAHHPNTYQGLCCWTGCGFCPSVPL